MAELREYLVMLHCDPSDPADSAALAGLRKLGAAVLGSEEAVHAIEQARRQLRRQGASDAALRLYDLEIEHAESSRRASLLVAKGEVIFDDLLDADLSAQCLDEALKIDPDNRSTKERIEYLEQIHVHWEPIVEKLLDEADRATEPRLATTLYRAAAETCARYRPGTSEIESYLRKALEIDGTNKRAALQLARLLGRAERHDDLREHLETCLEHAELPAVRSACWLRLAELAVGPLDDEELAVRAMQEIAEVEPGNPRALAFLSSRYESKQEWAALVSLYANALKHNRRSGNPDTEIDMLIQIGMLHWRKLGDPEAADGYFTRLRKLAPAHQVHLDFYKEFYVHTEQAGKLMQLYRQALMSLEPGDEGRKKQLMVELAKLSEESMDNPEKAIDSWKSILRLEPDNIEASESLMRLLERTGKWNALLDLLKDQVERLPEEDREGRIQGLLEVVEIYRDRLNLDVMVINTYKSILHLDPNRIEVLDALAHKYRDLGRWNDLVVVLERKAQVDGVGDELRAELLSEVATLWVERFGNYAQAVKPLEQLLGIECSHGDALRRLQEIYTRRRQWRSLIALLGGELGNIEPSAQVQYLADIATLAAKKLGDSRLAIHTWNQVLQLPDFGPSAKDCTLVYDALGALYEREKRYPALVEILGRKLELLRGSDLELPLLEKMGTILSTRCKAPQQAAAIYRQILKCDPTHAKATRVLREHYVHARDYEALQELMGEAGQWEELVEIYFSIADKRDERGEAIRLLERAGRVAQEHFRSQDKVARVFERLQSLDAENGSAAKALVPLYRQGAKWARLLSVYEILLAQAEPISRLEIINDMRTLCERDMGSKTLAFQWTARAFELEPANNEIREALLRLGAEADAWEEVVEVLDERAHSDGASEDERLVLLRELGDICAKRLQQVDRARSYFEEVLLLRSDDAAILGELEALATHEGNWPELLRVLGLRVGIASDVSEKVELLFKISYLEEEHGEGPSAAVKSYRAIVVLDPKSRRALRGLAKIYQSAEDWENLSAVLEATLAIGLEADSEAALHFRLGEMYRTHMGRHKEAREAFKRCLELAPSQQAQDALAYYLLPDQEPEVRREIARLLYPAFVRASAHQKIVDAIDILILDADLSERIRLCGEQAKIFEMELGQLENAFNVSAECLVLDPADIDNRFRLDRLGQKLNCLESLRDALLKGFEACQERRASSAVQSSIATEIAMVCDHLLDDLEAAERAWQRVMALDEDSETAYRALLRIFRLRERWGDLRALLEAKVERTRSALGKVKLHWQLAELCEGVLDDEAGAEIAFLNIVDADPRQTRAFSALISYCERGERWGELEELLGRSGEYLDGAALAANQNYRARLRAEKLDQKAEAIDLVEALLEANGCDKEARSLCESLLQDEAWKLRCAQILEPLYCADGAWEPLCEVLMVQALCAGGSAERLTILARVAKIQEGALDDAFGAMQTWMMAIKCEPSDAPSLAALLRLAPLVEGWEEVASVVEACVVQVSEGDLATKARLLRVCAEIHRDALEQPERALRLLEEILALDTSDTEIILYATLALDPLCASSSQFAKQASNLILAVEWTESSEDRVALLIRVAEIYEVALEDVHAALDGWRAVLAENPNEGLALASCARLLAAKGDTRELVAIVRRQVELMEPGVARAAELEHLASLFQDQLLEPNEAISCLLEVLDLDVDLNSALEALCDLYRSEERFDDLLHTLERRFRDCESGLQVPLLFEIGTLLGARLERDSDALDRLEEVLHLEPDHEGARGLVLSYAGGGKCRDRAARILEPLYESCEEYANLVTLLETLCADNDDSRAVVAHQRRIATILDGKLGDGEGAFEILSVAVRNSKAEPELAEILSELQRLASKNNSLSALVELYKEIAPNVFDGTLVHRLHLDIADLSRGALGDESTAREYYQLVLDNQPDDRRSLCALEEICRQGRDYEGLCALLVRKSELIVSEVDERTAALSEAGAICWEQLGRSGDAAMYWEQVLEFAPAEVEIAARLQDLYRKTERWHDLADAIEARLGFASTIEEAVELRWRLGSLYEEQLRDLDAAVENYGAAVGGDAGHLKSLAALERLLDQPDTRSAVADILEPIHVAKHNWPNLVRIYEIKLEAADDGAERLRITKYIARLYEEQLEDLDAAFCWLGRVFREEPSDRNVRSQLERLSGVLENWSALAKVYQAYLDDETGGGPEFLAVAQTLAGLYNQRLGATTDALAAYKRVLQADPENWVVFCDAESMLMATEDWQALVGFYEEVAHASANEQRRQQVYESLARLQEDNLVNAEKAVDAWRAVLEINPESAVALRSLERLLDAQQNWYELAELLVGQIERPRDEEQLLSSRMRLAKVRETNLEDVDGALDQLEQVLLLPGGDLALPDLERLIVNDDYQERIAGLLEPLYRERDWWQKLVVILNVQVAFAEDSMRRGEILREVAQIHEERGGDLALALEALGRAWLEDTSDPDLYDRFVALGLSLGSTPVVIDVLSAGVKEQFDSELAIKILMQLASLHEQYSGDRSQAVASLRRVLEISDGHALALFKLDRLLVTMKDWDGLCGILERRCELAESDDDQFDLLQRLANVQECEKSDLAAAIAVYRRVLSLRDGDTGALDSLERLYLATENWREIVGVLLLKVDASEEPSVKRSLHFELSELFESKLDDAYEAIAQMRCVLALDPDDARGLVGLRRLLEQECMWQDLLEVLDHETALSSGPDKVSRAFRAAELVEVHLMDTIEGLERYSAVLDLDGSHQGARDAVLAHCEEEETRERACEILERVFRAQGDYASLVSTFEIRLKSCDGDVDRAVELLADLALLQEESLGDLDAAMTTWLRCLRKQVDNVRSQEQVERLAVTLGSWDEIVLVYEALSEETVDSSTQYLCASKLGEIYEERLGELVKAASCYERALGVSTDEGPVLTALARVYERGEQYQSLADTLTRQVDATMDEHEQASLLFMLGDVRETRLAMVEQALGSYCEVLERDSRHEGARTVLERLLATCEAQRAAIIDVLEPLFEDDGDAVRLAYVLSVKVTVAEPGVERAQAYSRLAEVAEQDLHDPTRALDAVGGWLAEDPESERALEELERLGTQVDRLGEVVARLDGICASAQNDELRTRLGRRCARIRVDALDDLDGALASAAMLLAIDGDDEVALDVSQQAYRAQGEWSELAEVQWHRAGLCYDLDSKRALLAETAYLRLQLGRLKDCAEAWREVLSLNGSDAEALRELASLYRKSRSWHKLVDVLKAASSEESDLEADRVFRTEVAEVYSNEIGELDRAVEAWQSVLDLDPDALVPLDNLELLHRKREDFVSLHDVLLRRLDAIAGADAKIIVYLRLAELAEAKRDSPEEAVDFLLSIVELEPGHTVATEGIERLFRALERWVDLVEWQQRQAELCAASGDLQGELARLAQAADIWDGPLDDSDEAARVLEKLLALDSSSVSALTRLAKIYESACDWEGCSVVLEKALALGPQGRDAADLYVRLGEVARNKDGDEDKAEEYFGKALFFDGYHPGAIERVELASRQKEDWLLVADMVRRRYELCQEQAERLEIGLELSRLYGERLGQPENAIPLLETTLATYPDDERVIGPLADLYFQAGRHAEAAPMLEALAGSAKKKRKMKDVARYKQRLGGIFEAQGDAARAIGAYEEAFRVDPTNVRTMIGLGRIYMGEKNWDKARRVYRSMVLQTIDPEVGITKADVYFQLGEIHTAKDEVPKAKDMYRRALSSDPKHQAAKSALESIG